MAVLDGHVADVLCVAFRTDGRLLATASADGEVCVNLRNTGNFQNWLPLTGRIGFISLKPRVE